MGMGTAATLVAPAEILPLPRLLGAGDRTRPLLAGPRRVGAPAGGSGSGTRRFGEVVTSAPAMHDVLAVLERLALTDVTITLLGETGTGKDVFAHAIHEQSGRRDHPFVVFDCGAVPANLAESELFGHERGAFTGAVARHAGA